MNRAAKLIKRKTKRLNVDLDDTDHRDVKTIAAQQGVTVTAWIKSTIRPAIATYRNTRADRPFDGSAN